MPSSHTGLFITGTDTDSGKTWFGSRFASYLSENRVEVAPRKPAESGCIAAEDTLIPADASAYADAIHAPEKLDDICPYRYQAALAPPMAAALENQTLSLDMLQATCNTDVNEFLLVEGAGGFYSPIADDGLNADLAARLGLPMVLVAGDRLGCINHILLTLEAAQHRQLRTVAIILNEVEPPAADAPDNFHALESLTDIPVLKIGFQSSEGELSQIFSRLNSLLI